MPICNRFVSQASVICKMRSFRTRDTMGYDVAPIFWKTSEAECIADLIVLMSPWKYSQLTQFK